MRKFSVIFGLFAFILAGPASAGDMANMVGKWTWEGFTIDVVEGGANGITAKVISGPKNVGMDMIVTPLAPKDGAMVGKIKHPMTGETYNAKMTTPDPDSWKMDGCTDAGACASGTFKRVK